jgi:hypothetical protein
MTEDPDVHVMADGKRIEPVRLGEKRLTFMLPAAGSTIELRCRSFIPAHLDPASDDQRSLGICVGRLQFDGAEIAPDNEEAFALGWHGLEGDPEGHSWRWSCARTPLPAGTRLVVIDIAGASHLLGKVDEYRHRFVWLMGAPWRAIVLRSIGCELGMRPNDSRSTCRWCIGNQAAIGVWMRP